jgi:hypothetical protein
MRKNIVAAVVGCLLLITAPVPAQEHRLLEIDGFGLKWGEPVLGRGATVTYGLVTTSRQFPEAINCKRMTALAGLLSQQALARDGFDATLRSAFAMWSEVANLAFREAGPGESPDILIGTQGDPRGIAYTNVRFDAERTAGDIAPMSRASICLNPRVAWTFTEDGDNESYALHLVLAHEIGHAIGLDHPGPTGELMAYRYQEELAGLAPGDVAGAMELYGPAAPSR